MKAYLLIAGVQAYL